MRVKPSLRPSDKILDEACNTLIPRMENLLKYCGDVRKRMEEAASAVHAIEPANFAPNPTEEETDDSGDEDDE